MPARRRKPDFSLPSAEGEPGYPQDMVAGPAKDQYQVPEGVERFSPALNVGALKVYATASMASDTEGPYIRLLDLPKLRAAWAKEQVPDHIQVFRYEGGDLNYEPLDSAPKDWDGNLNDLIGDYISVEALGEIKQQWGAERGLKATELLERFKDVPSVDPELFREDLERVLILGERE